MCKTAQILLNEKSVPSHLTGCLDISQVNGTVEEPYEFFFSWDFCDLKYTHSQTPMQQ